MVDEPVRRHSPDPRIRRFQASRRRQEPLFGDGGSVGSYYVQHVVNRLLDNRCTQPEQFIWVGRYIGSIF